MDRDRDEEGKTETDRRKQLINRIEKERAGGPFVGRSPE